MEDDLARKRPVNIKVVDETEGRFVIMEFADGHVQREAVDPKKKPSRRPRRRQHSLRMERMNRTRKKLY